MPRITKRKKQSKNTAHQSHQHIDDISDDNFSGYDEPVENNNAASIINKLQEAANKYYQETTSHKSRRLRYIGNSKRNKRRKNQKQREAAKGTHTLHTFWDVKKSADEEVDDNTSEQSDDEAEDYNWHNKIPAALENLELDIKKEKVNSEVWVRLNGIRLYLQLVKNGYLKMEASDIVANATGKGVYHARCIRSWAYEYVITRLIPYSRRGHHAKIWSFLWDEESTTICSRT